MPYKKSPRRSCQKTISFKPFPDLPARKGDGCTARSRRRARRKSRKISSPVDRKLEQLGQSRTWLAVKVGVSPQCLGNYINGKRLWLPDRLVTRRVMQILGCDLNFLLTGSEHPAL